MWEVYDSLLEQIPDDAVVDEFVAGLHWFVLRVKGAGAGMAMNPREGSSVIPYAGSVAGRRLIEIAEKIKSWNNHEAAMGLAAINAWINSPDLIRSREGVRADFDSTLNFFDYIADRIRGRKVAVIGHFRGLEKLAETCELSILERFPQPGDYPDPSCEYILPLQDFVFITGTTLINKTLPRLLQLSSRAVVALVGPSVPMTPVLFNHGISFLAGTAVIDYSRVRQIVMEGGQHQFFDDGARMVKMTPE